jgi:hypothetical protein
LRVKAVRRPRPRMMPVNIAIPVKVPAEA